MQRKLLVAAVAAALAAPAVALAQSSVTISGQLKGGMQNVKFSGAAAGARPGHSSEWRFTDEASRIGFDMREDLGGGLTAVGSYQIKPTLDGNIGVDPAGIYSSGGENFIGLQSSSWGLLRIGSVTRHITISSDSFAATAPVLALSPYTGKVMVAGAAASSAVAGATRTRNQIGWDSPNWSGFTLSTGWSTRQAGGLEGDLTAPTFGKLRKGNAWWFTPRYGADNWFVGASYLSDKQEPAATTATTLKGWRLAGRYSMSGFSVGLTYDRTKMSRDTATAAGITTAEINNRTAYDIPLEYTTGPHTAGILYSRAKADKMIANSASRAWALRYAYALSKRTTLVAGYSTVRNNAGAIYGLSGDDTTGVTGSTNALPTAGEDVRAYGVGMKHTF